jgi:multidrug efflux pump
VFARFFIDRPIFAWVLSIVIVLLGGVSALFLPIDMYPPIIPPTVQVTAVYPGANAQVVADAVAAPIEEQVNGVENMLYMSSQSANDGSYALTVTFQIGTDPNVAQVLVQNRVALAMPQLPPTVQIEGVSTKKSSPNILLAVNLVSPDHRFNELYLSNYATIHIQDELARLKGVGDVHLFGQRNYSMRIWLDPEKLAARSLTAVDVVNAITNQNVQVAAGAVGQQPAPPGQQLQLTMSALGQLETVQQFANIILKSGPVGTQPSSAGGPATPTTPPAGTGLSTVDLPVETISTPIVRVKDVAEIELGAQNYDQIAKADGEPSTGIALFQLPGSNALDVATRIKERMEVLKRDFPEGLEYRIVYDTTPFIRESVNDVFRTLLEAVVLVAIVVLFFLQDWKAMILPMIDVPVSLVGTFAVMALLGFSLNNLTLFGLVLAIGIVVDDAIVVLENIERLIATGLNARDATIQAMGEITGPIIAITLVLCAVFLPSTLVPGLTGQFYRQFAVTIATAMIISALNALTLTPSRAVTIFRTEENAGGHEPVKQALPWWFFAIVGGIITVQLAPRTLPWLGLHGPDWEAARDSSSYVQWLVRGAYLAGTFLPGALVGGLVGWFTIGVVNRFLGAVFGKFNQFFDWLTDKYGRFIARTVRLSIVVMVGYLGLLGLTGWRVTTAPTGFIPTQDQGYLLLNVQLPDAASVQRTQAIMERITSIARGDKNNPEHYPGIPGVAHTVSIAGQSFLLNTSGSNLGSMFVVLQEFDQRRSHDRYDAAIAAELQRRCDQEIEGAVISVLRAPPIRGVGNAGGFKLQVEQHGFVDLKALQKNTDDLTARANEDPHFGGVFSIYRAAVPQLFIDIDRAKVESLNVPIKDVFTTLQAQMGGLYVNQFVRFGRTWQVQVQAAPRFRESTAVINELQVRNSAGQMVPLGTVSRVKNSTGPVMVMRYNMYASAPINGNPAPGVSSGEVVDTMTRLANELGIRFEWTEMTFLQVQAGNIALLIFALGAVFVYLVLAAKYESWRLPLAVILVVPLCMLAAVEGMVIAHLEVNIFVQIGLLVLIGLASKNAILIVEYARQLQIEGKELHEAIREASVIRFRPIVMTSLAFIFGVVPLVLATGAGSEMRQSLGVAVFAGMIGVTLFGLILTPTFYFVLMWTRRNQQAPIQSEPPVLPQSPVHDGSSRRQPQHT